ncbi:glycoside hydrolase family 3 C-terminal domain-containing protein [Aestuariibacter sp. AA17]|uniref:beta-glucosidase n=1 Tax=Fluctibacter corallii TaxID=2984329 RepID=A0ABT3A867_9ALTE|nr:glycoside hydrolase family 3 N-terminal domain-containing protein [Aestuariibacter sp. AA17]MCV2884521.1 glycoside hydrolase family 3 C-terminal domain-containing protein [Aestuariibacter sp. AA17]
MLNIPSKINASKRLTNLPVHFSMSYACVLIACLLISMSGCERSGFTSMNDTPTQDETVPMNEQQIDELISRMTLAEKVGQMTQAERKRISPEEVRTYFIGSILNGGGSVPKQNRPQDWREMIDAYQHAALSTRLGIPIIYGTDAVHGHSNVKNATLFPHNIGLGAMRDPALIEKIAEATAKEVAATGVHWNFAPALCVARDIRWGRTYECFAEDPEVGMAYSAPYVRGMQASGLVLATAKHWVGDGGTTYGTGDHEYVMDRGNTQITEDALKHIHIAPYLGALEESVGSIMFSYSSFNGVKMHEHAYLNNHVLKQSLGFGGFAVSDWQAIEEINAATNRERIVKAINAGLDMAMEPEHWKAFISDLTAAVEAKEIPMTRIDDAVKRILMQKMQIGLFEKPLSADRVADFESVLGHDAHRSLAREAVQKSAVLLKNEHLLPLSPSQKIFVAGEHANNIGLQSGGWSVEWQGQSGDITKGTTLLEGMQSYSTNITFSEHGEGAEGHDVAVVFVGEQPYAEGYGDYGESPCQFCQPLSLSQSQIATIERIQQTGTPVVVVLISGRPLLISEHLPGWQGLVAAWLPGTEGAGVADVLFGHVAPTGQLPVTWPKSLQQITLKVGDAHYQPLFEYGFGLTYN